MLARLIAATGAGKRRALRSTSSICRSGRRPRGRDRLAAVLSTALRPASAGAQGHRFDPVENRDFEYHTGISFMFSARLDPEHGTLGGWAGRALSGRCALGAEPATGFTLQVHRYDHNVPCRNPRSAVASWCPSALIGPATALRMKKVGPLSRRLLRWRIGRRGLTAAPAASMFSRTTNRGQFRPPAVDGSEARREAWAMSPLDRRAMGRRGTRARDCRPGCPNGPMSSFAFKAGTTPRCIGHWQCRVQAEPPAVRCCAAGQAVDHRQQGCGRSWALLAEIDTMRDEGDDDFACDFRCRLPTTRR